MELKSVTLAAIFITLLISGPVESARGRKRKLESLLAPLPLLETELGQAIDRRDFETVKKLCKQDEALCEEGINYVIDTKNPDDIAEFIKRAELLTGYTLLALWRKQPEIRKEIFGKIGISPSDMDGIGSRSNPMRTPEKVIALLDKVTIPNHQELTIAMGIKWLFIAELANDYIDPLLTALSGKKFLCEGLKYYALGMIFILATQYRDEL